MALSRRQDYGRGMFLARHSGQLGRPPRRRCVTRQAAFLAAYRKTASIAAAAKAAGIKPAQHYRWLATSAAYWETFTDLQADVTGSLQDRMLSFGRCRCLGRCTTRFPRAERIRVQRLASWERNSPNAACSGGHSGNRSGAKRRFESCSDLWQDTEEFLAWNANLSAIADSLRCSPT